MNNRIKAPAMAMAAALVLSGCNLLDVDNPNSLVEESIKLEAAANGVVNGALNRISNGISDVWEGYLVTSDELYWIGSRDAWGQLDQGFVGNPENEFLDSAFPSLGQGVWMAQNAVDILTEHSANGAGFEKDLARAQLFNGMILMVTGEVQEDMTFSNKMEDGAPVGPAAMSQVLDRAITNLDAAVSGFQALGEDDLVLRARSVRARATMSRTMWNALNPNATVGGAMAFASSLADANYVIDNTAAGWQFDLSFSSGTGSCNMCGNINERKENQIDLSLVTVDASNDINGIALMDPVSGAPDLTLINRLNQWKSGSYLSSGNQYSSLTVSSERLMRLIVAEDALANGNVAAFEAQIDALRALVGEVEWNSGGAVSDLDMLMHSRRVGVLLMGLRLADMYRWGLTDPQWQSGSDAILTPGEMLPITIVEVRANCNLNGNGCSG
jgi:hypothetical protein